MMTTRSIPWARIFAEGVAIVVSILLAFWIQAWWEGRQQRDDEIIVLSNLLEELRQVKVNINDTQDYQVAILASTYRLAELAEYPDSDISEQEVNRLLADQTWISTPNNFSAPVLNSVIGRGDDRLISDRTLRAQLVLLPTKFDWIRENMQEELDFVQSKLEPFINKNASILHFSQTEHRRPGNSGFVFPKVPVETRTAFSNKALLQHREFQNLMLQRSIILEEIISLGRDTELPAQIDDAIASLERELARHSP